MNQVYPVFIKTRFGATEFMLNVESYAQSIGENWDTHGNNCVLWELSFTNEKTAKQTAVTLKKINNLKTKKQLTKMCHVLRSDENFC